MPNQYITSLIEHSYAMISLENQEKIIHET